MSFFQNRNLKIWSGLMIGVGVIGTVFFFPVNFQSRYTCLYHRIFHPGECVHSEGSAPHEHSEHPSPTSPSALPEEAARAGLGVHEESTSYQGGRTGETPMVFCENHDQATTLVRHYVNHFAFFWWGSIILIGLGAYSWRLLRAKKN